MGSRLQIDPGTMFANWTVIGESEPVYYVKAGRTVPSRAIVVRCVCGTIRSVLLHNLSNKRSKSCGCRGNPIS